MHYNVRNILSSTALALLIGLAAPTSLCAQTLNTSEVQPQANSNNDSALNFDVNLPGGDTAGNNDVNAPIPLDDSVPMPLLDSEQNMPMPENHDPILPMNDNAPIPTMDNAPIMPDNTRSYQDNTMPGNSPLLPGSSNADNRAPIPDLINVDGAEADGMGDNILNKIDNNLFSKMSSIEKQSALLSLELRREKIRSEIAAIKAQRKKAQEEEAAREEERNRKRIEWENEQQRKLLVEQQKLKELENQREVLRQEKIVKAYKETMLKEKQEWIKHNADLYNQMIQIENERDAVVNDFKMKLNNLNNMATKAVSNAQTAKDRYDQAINSMKSQLSVVQSRLDAELSAKLSKANPFATMPDENQVKLNDVYAIMEIVGKGENLAAKLINKNGDRFMVRKGTALQTGHIVDEITETYVRADIDGAKDYLWFAAGGILDSEPQKSNVLKGAKAAMAAAGAKKGNTGVNSQVLGSPDIPSLGEGMFVR